MTNPLKNITEAASYTGLPVPFFKNQLKHGTGPDFVMPGQRAKFFRQEDLDAWMKTWIKGKTKDTHDTQD